jgi:hypothetical protein
VVRRTKLQRLEERVRIAELELHEKNLAEARRLTEDAEFSRGNLVNSAPPYFDDTSFIRGFGPGKPR